MRDDHQPIRCCHTARNGAIHHGGQDPSASQLQAALLNAIGGLAELMAQLSAQLSAASAAAPAPEAWCQPLPPSPVPAPERTSGHRLSPGPSAGRSLDPVWDELSVVELRGLLRSYPVDRTSLPAPIELLRRGELLEALSQLQALAP